MAEASYSTAEAEATPRVRALLLERLAWTHAVAGEAQAADRALNEAMSALHSSDDRPEPDWVFWVDDVEIEIMTGRCWTELRRPLRAVSTLERVMGVYDDTHARDKSMYLTWLAHAYLDAGEVEQGARVLRRSVDLAHGVASVRPAIRIKGVVDRLRVHEALPDVSEVIEAARGVR